MQWLRAAAWETARQIAGANPVATYNELPYRLLKD
jgi:hypothetical protein